MEFTVKLRVQVEEIKREEEKDLKVKPSYDSRSGKNCSWAIAQAAKKNEIKHAKEILKKYEEQ